jgi:hypothetical protein
MVMQLYEPDKHLFTEQDGTEHKFFNGESEFPDEAMTLIRFKQGTLTLQEAYSILLNLARVPKNKFTVSEFAGDVCMIMGANSLEDLQKLQKANQQEEF